MPLDLDGYPPVGPVTRPNGMIYHPRSISGFEDLALMESWWDNREFPILLGPPGTGKSAVVEGLFEGVPIGDSQRRHKLGGYYLVCSRETTTADFLGSWVKVGSNYEWKNGPLLQSLIDDVPFFADEILLGDARTLSLLYPLMDGRGEIGVPANPTLGTISAGPNWWMMAAGNPDVPGAQFSEALRDRFDYHVTIGTDFELCERLGVGIDVIRVAQKLDHMRVAGEISWSPQMRSLLSFEKTRTRYGKRIATANLYTKFPEDDRTNEDVITAIESFLVKPELLEAASLSD